MTLLPPPEVSSGCESEAARQGRRDTDRLISISDIRSLFKLGRTAALPLPGLVPDRPPPASPPTGPDTP
jgi:hypothetical protein